MRWIFFLILAYIVVLFQTTFGRALIFNMPGVGTMGPDLAAILAVFVALRVKSGLDAMLAAWVLGLGVDLTMGGAAGAATVVGPMAVGYCLSAGLVYRVREAFFRERVLPQIVLVIAFCIVAHVFWIVCQSLLAAATWSGFAALLIQALGLALYTAVLTPLGHFALSKCQVWFLHAPPRRTGRLRR